MPFGLHPKSRACRVANARRSPATAALCALHPQRSQTGSKIGPLFPATDFSVLTPSSAQRFAPARTLLLLPYVGSVLLANVFLDTFIALPLFGLLSVGSIFFAAVFTLRDALHTYGLRTVYWAIALALLVNAAYGHWIAHISTRFLLASFLSILLSELLDTALFARLHRQRWHTRVLASNAVSVPLDSTAFTLLAFSGVMGVWEMAQIIYADILGKYAIAALLAYLPFLRPKPVRQTAPQAASA